MNPGTVISLVLSAFALLVSGATLYLTLLRKKAALVGCILAMTIPEAVDREDWNFEFALANTGDVELLLRDVDVDLPTGGLVPEIASAACPVVLGPGQVRSLALKLPNKFCRRISQSREPLTFKLHFFSSRGTAYISRASVTLTEGGIEAPKSNWAPFTLGRAVR